jgi:ADP-L-glycero-D-manno-heptose 6-epimerase
MNEKFIYETASKQINTSKRTAIVRPFNVFGNGEDLKEEMMSPIYKWIKEPSNTINLFGEDSHCKAGEQSRDFIYVNTLCNVIYSIITRKLILETDTSLETFNIGSGRSTTFNEAAICVKNALKKTMNIDKKINYISMPEKLKGKYQYYTKASLDDPFLLGFTGATLEEAILDMISDVK